MRIRRKIEPDPAHPSVIRTVRGGGYLFLPGWRNVSRRLISEMPITKQCRYFYTFCFIRLLATKQFALLTKPFFPDDVTSKQQAPVT
jgi:hypothetical protein